MAARTAAGYAGYAGYLFCSSLPGETTHSHFPLTMPRQIGPKVWKIYAEVQQNFTVTHGHTVLAPPSTLFSGATQCGQGIRVHQWQANDLLKLPILGLT